MNDRQMYAVYDKDTNEPIYWEYDQNKVLFVAHKVGRKTVTVGPVEPNEIKNRQPLMVENESFALEFSNYLSEKNVRKSAMNESTIISLTEMKIENVKEDLLIPNTSNPEKEAKELTDDTGVYHYTVDDDLTGKPAIVRTNVKALNEEEWIRKSFYTADSNVIEPNNFEKNDEYSVRDIDKIAEGDDPRKSDEDLASMSDEDLAAEHKSAWRKMGTLQATDYMDKIKKVASERGTKLDESYDRDAWEAGYDDFENGRPCPTDESGKDGWLEAKKEHRKEQMMQEDEGDSDTKDWREVYTGMFKHNYLPLAYDDNSGQVTLFDITDANSLETAEVVGVFADTPEMTDWIKNNLKEGVEDEYKSLAEDANFNSITTSDHGVNNNDGDNYGPAPEDDQNDLTFDDEGRAIIEAKFKPSANSFDSFIDLPDRDDVEVTVDYDIDQDDPSVGHVGGVVITCVTEKGTENDLMDSIDPDTANRLFDEASADASRQEDDYGDYKYDQMRDDRMMDEAVDRGPIFYHSGPNDRKKIVFYKTNDQDIRDDNLYIGEYALKSEKDLNEFFPKEKYGDYKFEMLDSDGRRYDGGEEDQFTYDEIADDLRKYGSEAVDEGKDHRFDPDADDDDWDRQDKFKRRNQDRKNNRKEVDEASYRDQGYQNMMKADQKVEKEVAKLRKEQEKQQPIKEANTESDRVYIIAAEFTNNKIELEHKGMMDIDAAIDIVADGEPKDQIRDEIAIGGVPASYEINRDGSTVLVVLDSTMRSAIELMCSMEECQGMLDALEINEDVFFGFLIQARTGDILDDSTDLEEDENFDAPDFVVSTEKLNDAELAQDPAFIQTMKDSYFEMAEEVGERIEDWDPSLAEIDAVIYNGINNYPYAQKYSFLINDPAARDAVNSAFNILWDEGKIQSHSEEN